MIQRRGPAHAETQEKRPGSIEEQRQIRNAIMSRDIETIRKFLESGIDPNVHMVNTITTFFQFAAMKGNREVVELFIDFGANINDGALKAAIDNNLFHAPEIVKLLVQRGVSAQEVTNALFVTAYTTTTETVDAITYLIEHGGANVNAKQFQGTPLLSYIIDKYSVQRDVVLPLVKLLISKGANVNQPNDFGETPLTVAAHNMNRDIVVLLLHHGADPQLKNTSGDTLLASIARTGSEYDGMIDLLHQRGIDTSDPLALSNAINSKYPYAALKLLELNPDGNPKTDYAHLLATIQKKISQLESDSKGSDLWEMSRHFGYTLDDQEQAEVAFKERIELWGQVRDALQERECAVNDVD